jgi:hypothetical protein
MRVHRRRGLPPYRRFRVQVCPCARASRAGAFRVGAARRR